MANRDAGAVVIRLSLRQQEALKRQFEDLPPAARRAFRKMVDEAKPVSREFKAMDGARKEFQDGVDDLVRQSGPLGRFLQSIGPWGIGAAAGLGALYVAANQLHQAMGRAVEFARYTAQVRDIAEGAETSIRYVLDLGNAVQLSGGQFDAAGRSVEEWTKRLGRVRALGQGEAFDALKVLGLGPDDFRGMSAEQALESVIDRLYDIDDISSRIALADRLGLSGMTDLLRRSREEAEATRMEVDRINAGLSERTLQRLAAAADRLDEFELRRERAGQVRDSSLIGPALLFEERRTALVEQVAEASQLLIPIRERDSSILEDQLETLEKQRGVLGLISRMGHPGAVIANYLNANEVGIRQALSDAERHAMVESSIPARGFRGPFADPDEAFRGSRGEGDLLPLDERRRLESMVARELGSLRSPMEDVAELERDLNRAREHGLDITEAQIAQIIARRRELIASQSDEAKAAEAEQRRLDQLVETQLRGLMTPAQRAEEMRRDLEEAQRRGAEITDKQITAITQRMIPEAERLLTPLERQKDLMESLIEPLDRLRERKADLQAVMAQYPEHADLVVMELRRVQAEIDEFEGRTSRFTGLARLAAESRDWDRQLEGVALGGLGAVERGLEDIVMQWRSVGDAVENTTGIILSSLARIAIQQAIVGPVAGGLFSMFGGTSAGGATSGGMNLGWSLPGGPGSVYHSGTAQAGHGFGPVRPMTGLDRLPRFHSGRAPLGSGEMGAIIEREERIFSASDNRALIESINYATRMSRTAAAAAATGQGQAIAVELYINGEKQSGNVRARRTPGGGVRMDVQLKGAVAGLIEGGAMDGAMSKRFGLRPSART